MVFSLTLIQIPSQSLSTGRTEKFGSSAPSFQMVQSLFELLGLQLLQFVVLFDILFEFSRVLKKSVSKIDKTRAIDSMVFEAANNLIISIISCVLLF